MLEQNEKLPFVDVTDDSGRTFNTREWVGKTVVLWFYPKDDTPG